jgi:superfamily I DNA/RNA helicase
MLAMIRARRFADEDSKVLFVCFNSLLADWLERELPEEYRNLITIRNYHKLCAEWVKRAGIPWPNAGSDAEFWKSKAPRLFEQALDRLPDDRFDAVVVDEGQDFETDWWDGLEMVNRNMTDGALFVFLDPAQRIFSESQAYLPVLGEPFTLPVNCRNTEAIANKCGQVLGENIRTRPGAPKGREPVRIVAETSAAQASAVEKQVKEWLNAGLKPSQIAVVTARSVENGCLHRKDRLAGALLTDDLARWRKGEGVLISTVGKFKGLEADAIVLTDVPEYSPYFRKEHLYVACSRAKHLLTVITLTPDQAD